MDLQDALVFGGIACAAVGVAFEFGVWYALVGVGVALALIGLSVK